MARRKKSPVPKKKEQGGEKVIDQLLGSLDDDNDIEGDIADLGNNEPEDDVTTAKPAKKKRFFFG